MSPLYALPTPASIGAARDVDAFFPDLPADYGYQVWSEQPWPSGTQIPTKGVLCLTKVFVPKTIVISTIAAYVTTAGTALATCFAAVYDSTGALVTGTSTADQSTPWQSTGLKSMAIGTPSTSITGGVGVFVWVGLLNGNGSTTGATFIRRTTFDTTSENMNLSAATFASGQTGAALTALPASFTPSGLVNNFTGRLWVALT